MWTSAPENEQKQYSMQNSTVGAGALCLLRLRPGILKADGTFQCIYFWAQERANLAGRERSQFHCAKAYAD